MYKFSSLLLLSIVSLSGQTTISDFSNFSPGSTYGSWAPDGVAEMQSGANEYQVVSTNFGGAYKYLGSSEIAPDLSDDNQLSLSVAVNSQDNGNRGIGFLVLLEDRDGTVYKYSRFGVQDGPQTLIWNLHNPSSIGKEGAVPGFDFSDIQSINLQVDPGGANSYDVSFQELSGAVGADDAPQVAQHYVTKKGIAYADRPDDPRYAKCMLDLYYPEGARDFTTVVWIHSGGMRQGHRYIPGELMNQGFAVVAIDYSLYPDAEAPDFIEDTAAAVAWTFNNIGKFGGDPERIVVAGSSAGGYLSMMVGLDKEWLADFGIDANRLLGIASLAGQAITHVAVREEKGGNRAKPVIDELAPLYYVRGDAPPLLLVTGDRELELLGRYEENAYMKRMMEINGHNATQLYEIKGADHGAVEKPGHQFLVDFVKSLPE